MAAVRIALVCLGLAGAAAKNLRASDANALAPVLATAATPGAPSRRLAATDWQGAAGKFVKLSARRPGIEEVIYAKSLPPGAPAFKCGTPCVAHCIAGQPRDLIANKGLQKSIRHRLFDEFSKDPVVFALLAVGASKNANEGEPEGDAGYVRTEQGEVANEELLPSLQYMGVDRAVLLREACTSGECMQQGLHLKCNAAELNVSEPFDKKTGLHTNMCEIQVSRFRDAMELVRDYEEEHQMKFDWVTRPRPDVYFTRPAPAAVSLDANAVHVSRWAACGFGGMDWFYAMPRKFADTFVEFASADSGVSCSDYKSSPKIAETCSSCLGCECWMAAWLYKKNVNFQMLPWQWHIPTKFCGPDCPEDWEVNADSIMGMDERRHEEPCHRGAEGVSCPVLLETSATVYQQEAELSLIQASWQLGRRVEL